MFWLRTDFVLDALEQAIYDRCGTTLAGLVHHSDRVRRTLSMRYTDRLADDGIAPSVGSRGDLYDNALAESVIGLFKTEDYSPTRPVAHAGGSGIRDARVGGLVQHPTLAGADWLCATGRGPGARYYEQAAVA